MEIKKITEGKYIDTLKDLVEKETLKFMTSGYIGFEEDEAKDYYVVEVRESKDENGDVIVVEVRAELNYGALEDLATRLDKIVKRYDKEAYFDIVSSGIIQAVIDKEAYNRDKKRIIKADKERYAKEVEEENKEIKEEAVDTEAVKEKIEQDKQDTGIEETVDTENELKEALKKEVYAYTKQQGLDLEKLRKQGIELDTLSDAIDKVVGDMVSKSVIEYEDATNTKVQWDFQVGDNDIQIIIQ